MPRRFPRLRRSFPGSLEPGQFSATLQEHGDLLVSAETPPPDGFEAVMTQAGDTLIATISDIVPLGEWIHIEPGGGGGMVDLEPAHADATGNTWYMATDISGAFRSDDGGHTWKDLCATLRVSMGSLSGVSGVSNVLASDPTNVNRVYYAHQPMGCYGRVTLDHEGVFRSTDKGETWTELTSAAAKDIARGSLICDNAGRLFGFKSSTTVMYVSEDQGNNWSQRTAPITHQPGDGDSSCTNTTGGDGVMVLICAPNNRVFYANPFVNTNATSGGVYRTDNQGTVWTRITSLNGVLRVIDIACHPTNSNRILACMRNQSDNTLQIWVSSDNGTTFTRDLAVTLASNPPVNPLRGGIAIDKNGVAICIPMDCFNGSRPNARSTSSGDIGTWTTYVPSLVLSGGNYVYTTHSSARTRRFRCHPKVAARWLTACMTNIVISDDANATSWRRYAKGIAITAQSSLVVDRTNPNRIFNGCRDVGLLRSENAGTTWIDRSPTLHGFDSYGICQSPIDANIWYHVRRDPPNTPGSIFEESTDGGISWTSRSNPPDMNFPQPGPNHVSIIVDPLNGDIIYAAWSTGGNLFKSVNRGASFAVAVNGTKMENVILRGRHLYGYTGNGISGSGNTFVKYNIDTNVRTTLRAAGPSVCGFDVHPTNDQIMWVCEGTVAHIFTATPAKGVLLKSTNGGGSWTPVTKAGKNFSPHKIYIDPVDPNVMLMASYFEDPDGVFHGVQISTNAGVTWTDLPSDLPHAQCVTNFVYGGVPGRVYALPKLAGCMVINGLY